MPSTSSFKSFVLIFLLLMLFVTACGQGRNQPIPTPTASFSAPALPEAMVTFMVRLPDNTPLGQPVLMSVLDEVSGLAFNVRRYEMHADDDFHYTLSMPLPVGTTLKYRYSRQGTFITDEHISDGRPVRYRLYHVEGPGVVQDTISSWSDTSFSGETGRIVGHTLDAQSGNPIPNLLVTAGGSYTLSAADGSFLLEGLPPGTHNLVVYALDGAYYTFQQGAVVAVASATPAEIRLTAAPLVNVIFTVTVPAGTLPAIPIRMAGNLLQFGNTFSELTGGLNTLAARMPVLSPLPDGRYSLAIPLPVGADLYYKYTLGDGFWNAEHLADGAFRLRHLVIPNQNGLVVEETIEKWSDGSRGPVLFSVTVPQNTPANDVISIQFNPYGWTESIPMWPMGGNQWAYVLYSPLSALDKMGYRYCRNGQCGSADDALTPGSEVFGRMLEVGEGVKSITDTVDSWMWIEEVGAATVPSTIIRPRGTSFMAGVELQASFHPAWTSFSDVIATDVRWMGANWIVFTPTWSYPLLTPPILEPLAGSDPLWSDMLTLTENARSLGLNVALFPTARLSGEADQWWESGRRDFGWWVSWFDRYRNFILHYADFAQKQGVQTLILGGEWLTPALPGAMFANGLPSGVPADTETRWRDLLKEIRTHYAGTVLWAFPFTEDFLFAPSFLDAVDGIYLLWSEPLASYPNALESTLHAEAARLLDERLEPFQQKLGKPIILAVSYPSADGGTTGCLPDPLAEADTDCLNVDLLARPNADIPTITLDLTEQAEVYDALLVAINERDFISGFVSRGFYPPAILHDKSPSVHGKPAGNVLWYWFPRMLAATEP